MNNRANLLDLIDRSLDGPLLSEQDFDMKHVAKGVKKIVKKYDIHVEDDCFLATDEDLIDRIWDGAMEFMAECGVYSKDTGRLIQYAEWELRERVRMAPAKVTFGRGRDALEMVARKRDSKNPAFNLGGCVGTPCPNEYFEPIVISYLQEPRVELFCPPTNEHYRGRDIRTRTPLEIHAAYDEVTRVKEIAHRCGRSGIHEHGICISVSDIGQLSAGHNMFASDGMGVGIISEMKVDNTILNKLSYGLLRDQIISAYANPIYGGLSGGIAGQVLLLVADMIMCSAIFMSENPGTTPTHPMLFCSTTKELIQATSLAFAAVSKHSNIITRLTGTQVGGCGTKTLLYETIATGLVATKSGFAYLKGPRSATGVVSGVCSGLEARFQGEVLQAAAKIDYAKAEEIIGKAYENYKDDLDKKPYGLPFWEVYDVKTVKPKDFWLKMYEEVKNEAISWGLPLDEV